MMTKQGVNSMSEEVALIKKGNTVAEHFKEATDVAGVCKEIVVHTAVKIQNRKYVRVEGWQAIAAAHGCVASAKDVKRIDGGVSAIGEVRRMADGCTISTAEGFVGDDEPTWANRHEYAKRAMAQTRAISRACRSVFAHVVVLMNAGLETTPAEEVPDGGFVESRIIKPNTDIPPESAKIEQSKPPVKKGAVANTFQVLVGLGKVVAAGKRTYTKAEDGEYYSTFDTKTGEEMMKFEERDALLTYTLNKGKDGKEYRTVLLCVEPGAAAPAEKPDDDNIPF